MMTYEITNKAQIRDYICRGINPGKTLHFIMFGEPVKVTLALDNEMELVYRLAYAGQRKAYHDFEKLIHNIESFFDACSKI